MWELIKRTPFSHKDARNIALPDHPGKGFGRRAARPDLHQIDRADHPSLVSLVIYLIPLIALLLGFDAIVGQAFHRKQIYVLMTQHPHLTDFFQDYCLPCDE